MRPTYAEVDLGAIRHNVQAVREEIGPETHILVPVKANAYGHGLIEVSRTVLEAGVHMLGVAFLEEGMALRQARIGAPVLVLGSELPERAEEMVRWSLTATLCTWEFGQALSNAARRLRRRAVVHVKVDTGMGRIGLKVAEIFDFITSVAKLPGISLEGIYTHFPSADIGDERFTFAQIEQFSEIVRRIRAHGIDIPLAHAANSAAILRYPSSHLDMVRPGIMIYGLEPFPGVYFRADLRAALRLKSCIAFLKDVPPGMTIGYGQTFQAKEWMKIATIPVGYGDGYRRALSNRGQVLVGGQRAKIVGNICMDQMMIDVTKIKSAQVGNEVVLIGSQGDEQIKAEEIARLCGTINYEVVCALTARVPRVYV